MVRHEPKTREALEGIFREIACTLGGIFSVYGADDELLWTITRELDRIFAAHLAPAPDEHARAARPHPHPAVVELLASLARHAARSRVQVPAQDLRSA